MGRQSRGTTGGLSKSAAGSRRVRQELTQTARELVERSFAHCYDTGGMRRTHLRGHKNILKRQLIHLRRSVQPEPDPGFGPTTTASYLFAGFSDLAGTILVKHQKRRITMTRCGAFFCE